MTSVRQGDTRPFKRDPNTPIRFKFKHANPFRWLPGHGEPYCYAEMISQLVVKVTAYLPVYIAIIVTLTLIVQIFGIPFVGGGR